MKTQGVKIPAPWCMLEFPALGYFHYTNGAEAQPAEMRWVCGVDRGYPVYRSSNNNRCV